MESIRFRFTKGYFLASPPPLFLHPLIWAFVCASFLWFSEGRLAKSYTQYLSGQTQHEELSRDLDGVKNGLIIISAWAFHEQIYRSDALVETPYSPLDPQSQGYHEETHTKHQLSQQHFSPTKRWLRFPVCQKISFFLSWCTCVNIQFAFPCPLPFH